MKNVNESKSQENKGRKDDKTKENQGHGKRNNGRKENSNEKKNRWNGGHVLDYKRKPACSQVCPLYVKPFCALPDGWCGKPLTFSNPCYLGIYNCNNPKKRELQRDTYTTNLNQCFVSAYKYFHEGDCLTTTTASPEQECGLIDCPKEDSPLCGLPKGFCADPKTFKSKCFLEMHNCYNPNERKTRKSIFVTWKQ